MFQFYSALFSSGFKTHGVDFKVVGGTKWIPVSTVPKECEISRAVFQAFFREIFYFSKATRFCILDFERHFDKNDQDHKQGQITIFSPSHF